MYGKNTLDKIYLTQKKLLPHPSTSQRGKTLIPRQSSCPPKGETLHPFKGKLLYPLKLKGELQFTPTAPCSLPPVLCSLFTDPCSLFTALYFMLKISCNTKKIVPLHQITFMGVDWF